MRLRRSDPSRPGYTRRRHGTGFSYRDQAGKAIADATELTRIRALAIPPAWRDVWICPDPRGHVQAVGTDAAGRRQYRYHDVWRAQRDAAKFDHVLEVGACLPKVREIVAGHLRSRGLSRERVLAAAVRLLDVGCFRIGGEEYASGDDATFGLATLRREHVTLARGMVRFCYPAKGGLQRTLDVRDTDLRPVLSALLKRQSEHPELLAYRNGAGWCDVRGADINAYLREISGMDITAKDFRTWNGTVLAAVVLAVDELAAGARKRSQSGRPARTGDAAPAGTGDAPPAGDGDGALAGRPGRAAGGRATNGSVIDTPRGGGHGAARGGHGGGGGTGGTGVRRTASARRKAVSAAMREVSDYLGNTPAVAKASYVDPRLVDLFRDGVTIAPVLAALDSDPDPQDAVTQRAVEGAVLELLGTGEEPDPETALRIDPDGGPETKAGRRTNKKPDGTPGKKHGR